MRLVLWLVLAAVVALLVGYLWGASGRSAATRARQAAELRVQLLEARESVLDARLDIYSVNFGSASRHLEAAKSATQAASADLNGAGGADATKRLQDAAARITEAQHLAAQLNQTANAKAGEAAQAIADVLMATTAQPAR